MYDEPADRAGPPPTAATGEARASARHRGLASPSSETRRLGVAIDHFAMPRRSWPRTVLISAASAAIIAAAMWAGEALTGSTLFLSSLVSSAVLIATAPQIRQCRPRRIITSHLVAIICGIAVHSLAAFSPIAVAIAVAAALAIVLLLDALHAPALANAGFAFAAHASPLALLTLTAITSFSLALCAAAMARSVRPSSAAARRWRMRSRRHRY
ncbi:HPP-family protein [Novosphingobium resinovorum]|uniref:HPP-family protein n=1 Tax=Novosphingobium resinovorum TaxID=158500 RepID=A0A031K5R9_9SPHN|nr:HPP family protein [Novosphingobium lentum]EZP83947.1 HPP-family protein [Novosphingobium resinovorum]